MKRPARLRLLVVLLGSYPFHRRNLSFTPAASFLAVINAKPAYRALTAVCALIARSSIDKQVFGKVPIRRQFRRGIITYRFRNQRLARIGFFAARPRVNLLGSLVSRWFEGYFRQ
jgi:hypothetical protein